MELVKPAWEHPDIPEDDMRWLKRNKVCVTSIHLVFRNDAACGTECIRYEFVSEGRESRQFNWLVWRYVTINDGDSYTLIRLRDRGFRALENLQVIDDWLKEHDSEHREWQRLNRVFGGGP